MDLKSRAEATSLCSSGQGSVSSGKREERRRSKKFNQKAFIHAWLKRDKTAPTPEHMGGAGSRDVWCHTAPKFKSLRKSHYLFITIIYYYINFLLHIQYIKMIFHHLTSLVIHVWDKKSNSPFKPGKSIALRAIGVFSIKRTRFDFGINSIFFFLNWCGSCLQLFLSGGSSSFWISGSQTFRKRVLPEA